MIVLDASLALEVLILTPLGKRHLGRLENEDCHAPHLIDLELINAIRRMSLAGNLDRDVAAEAVQGMKDWRLQRYGHAPLLDRIWELKDSVSVYDASYVALSELLDAPLLTCDGKLGRSHGHRANIVLLQ